MSPIARRRVTKVLLTFKINLPDTNSLYNIVLILTYVHVLHQMNTPAWAVYFNNQLHDISLHTCMFILFHSYVIVHRSFH